MASGPFPWIKKVLAESSKIRISKLDVIVFLISIFSIVDFGRSQARGVTGSELNKIEKHIRHHHINRRIAAAMAPIRDRAKSSLCTYEVVTDVNLQRIPDKIDRVLCRKDACRCIDQGDFRCTQLYTQLNVTYLSSDFKMNLDFDLIDVEYACVCSKAPEGSNVNLLEPVLV